MSGVVAPEIWYRYVDVAYAAPTDEFGESRHSRGSIEIQLREYSVIRHTAKGVWLDMSLGGGWSIVGQPDQRFVLNDARRRFACPTREEALASFVARKRAQIRIYRARVFRAECALRSAERVSIKNAELVVLAALDQLERPEDRDHRADGDGCR
jgi:hypothetical protein